MTLTNRLSAFFLAALALVLIGFSVTLYLFVRSYYNGQLDERLEAAARTLIATVESEPGGLEWDPKERAGQLGNSLAQIPVFWSVRDDQGHLVDVSRSLALDDPLYRDLESTAPPADGSWRFLSMELREIGFEPDRADKEKKKYAALVFTVAISTAPVQNFLRSVALALTGVSTAVWLVALLCGRWFCRRALAPITRMADQAREMNVDDKTMRLAIPNSRDEVEALGQSFNGVLSRLHEALERQRRFTGDASHQLRTPLTALLGQVEVALRHPRSTDEYARRPARCAAAGSQPESNRRHAALFGPVGRRGPARGFGNGRPIDLAAGSSEAVRPARASRRYSFRIDRAQRLLCRGPGPASGPVAR